MKVKVYVCVCMCRHKSENYLHVCMSINQYNIYMYIDAQMHTYIHTYILYTYTEAEDRNTTEYMLVLLGFNCFCCVWLGNAENKDRPTDECFLINSNSNTSYWMMLLVTKPTTKQFCCSEPHESLSSEHLR